MAVTTKVYSQGGFFYFIISISPTPPKTWQKSSLEAIRELVLL